MVAAPVRPSYSHPAHAEDGRRAVIAAIREHLYTPENLRTVIEYVRDELLALAKQEAKPTDQTKALREIEREVEKIKQAVRMGEATESLMEMLEDADRRRKTLVAGRGSAQPRGHAGEAGAGACRLARAPPGVPPGPRNLAQWEAGRARSGVPGQPHHGDRIHPDGTAEICGDLQRVLSLVSREKFTLVVPGGGFCLRDKPRSGWHSDVYGCRPSEAFPPFRSEASSSQAGTGDFKGVCLCRRAIAGRMSDARKRKTL